MLRDGINGFCMALADSVPGVSGGTVAFIMGFYDRFIGSIDALTSGGRSTGTGDADGKRKEVTYDVDRCDTGLSTR